ncbi:metallo-beta-lactamase [Lucifera butyrica]|uniref:Metallo-beta-lactamase n=1 Tax=Lucifera butyrica TaxID=1351585 RepID=A0A498R543_9FIRM|nr:MBL fold metallo-hydrolase [Lucifera butyrica]VBB05940.1 metallo-beta-lactamase [Lucifera butyrica]
MEIHVLASGSTGNAIFLQFENTKLLVDAGISARRIKQGLSAIGTAVEDLDGILLTHEHRDHVAGLTTLTRKYHLPVYARAAAWEAMPVEVVEECCCTLDCGLDIGDVKVEAFNISHDAADPVGFNFFHRHYKCSVATDLGFATGTVKKALSCSDAMVLESNHDLDMLKTGSYPWFLKQRIMSNRGHLSNVDAGWLLARLDRKQHTDVLLAHLSRENNRPELAASTVKTILQEQGLEEEKDFSLYLTYPDRTASYTHRDRRKKENGLF